MTKLDGYKKIIPPIDTHKLISFYESEEDIFGSMNTTNGLRDDEFYKNNDNLFSLTDIMIRKKKENGTTSYEFFGLHNTIKEKEKDKEKALRIANYYMTKQAKALNLSLTDIIEKTKNVIDRMDDKYFWISYLEIYNGIIYHLSAGISSIRDGQKLLGTAIDYLKTEGITTLSISLPNPNSIPFYKKMGFNMTSPPYTTPIDDLNYLNYDINIFLTSDSVADGLRKSKRRSKKNFHKILHKIRHKKSVNKKSVNKKSVNKKSVNKLLLRYRNHHIFLV